MCKHPYYYTSIYDLKMFSFRGSLKDIRYFYSNLTLVRSYVLAPSKKIPIFELGSMAIMSLEVIFEEACIHLNIFMLIMSYVK